MGILRGLRTSLGLRKPYLGKHVHIGRHTYYILDDTVTEAKAETPVTFGSFCSISRGVLVVADVLHSPDRVSTYPLAGRLCGEGRDPATGHGPLTIGNDVWIERRALILPGTTIGDGAVVVAGSVASGNIPPYAIFEGNPAKFVRYRFEEKIVETLLKIRWWDWSDEKITSERAAFYGPVSEFVARHRVD